MIAHGTASKYTNDGCRCVACTGAWAACTQHLKLRRKAYVAANGLPASISHGYSAYVNWGCRCDVCRAANTEYDRAASERRKAAR